MVPEPSKMQRLVLIDGHSLVYRAFFALPSLTDREGRVVNAAYGFTSMLLLALQEHPDYVLASFDLGGRTFRHEEREQHKATRRPTPPEPAPQFPLTRDMVPALRIPIFDVLGVEADDGIGTLATQPRNLALHSTIVTGDLDIKLDLSRGSAGDYRPDAARTMLADLGFRSLAARVPTTWRDGSTMSAPPIFAPVTKAQGQLELATETTRQPSQSTLALESEPSEAVAIVREAAELERLVAAFAAADRAGFQVITLDDVPRRGRVAALVIGLDDHAVYYAPLAHEQERCLELRDVLRRFAPSLQSARPSKLGFNHKTDYLALRAHGIELRGADWDLLVAAYLLNSGVRSPSLEALASDVLHRSIEGREALFGSGKAATSCDQVEVMRAAAFFGERMRVMLQLAPRLESELDRLGNAELFRELEMPLVPVLAEMELAGVSIDLPYLQQVSRELYEQLQSLDQEIADVAHGPINVNSPQQLARFLFEDLDLPGGRKTKSGYSTDASVLEGLRDQHPVVAKILEFRQLSKLKGTYVDALPLLVDAKTHRVHTSFNQTVAATGRLSSSDPNLQNIPIRTEVGQKVRRAFIPGRPGDVLLSADYSQIELRVLAHMTDDPVLADAFARR